MTFAPNWFLKARDGAPNWAEREAPLVESDTTGALDSVTLAEYLAASGSNNRAQAVLDALADPVTVRVYDGSGNVMGAGTMQTPWATRSGPTLTLGEVSAFEVLSSGTPDGGWYLRFESGTRWVRGSFGLAGSGAACTWSLPTWAVGQFGTLGTVTVSAPSSAAPSLVGAPSLLVFSQGVGGTYDFSADAVDPDGDAMTLALVGTAYTGISMAGGVLTVGTTATAAVRALTVRVTDDTGLSSDHACSVSVFGWLASGTIDIGSRAPGATYDVAQHANTVGGTPEYAVVSGPATINASSGLLTIDPSATPGPASIVVYVANGGYNPASLTLSVAVQPIVQPGTPYAGFAPTVVVTTSQGLIDALAAATPGTIIGVDPGILTQARAPLTAENKAKPTWRVAGSGSFSQPIVVVAKYQACSLSNAATNPLRTELRHTGPTTLNDDYCGPIVGCNDQSYVEWLGFYVDENFGWAHRDSGPVVLWGATNCAIRNFFIQGMTVPYSVWSNDNHNGVRLEGARNCVIANNYITGIKQSPNVHRNNSGVTSYDSRNCTVEHNYITDVGTGIFFKGDHTTEGSYGLVARHNHVHACVAGINAGMTNPAGAANEIAYNLITLSGGGGGIRIGGESAVDANWDIHHNTVENNGVSGTFPLNAGTEQTVSNVGYRDNIFVVVNGGPSTAVVGANSFTQPFYAAHHNRYWAASGSLYWSYNGSSYTAIGNWQTATGEYSSTTGDPLFANRAGGDYTLAPSSPCLNSSSTGGAVGCYVPGGETIGVETV